MTNTSQREKYRDAIIEAFEANGGELHREQGREELQQRFDLSPEQAKDILETYVNFNENGWSKPTSWVKNEYSLDTASERVDDGTSVDGQPTDSPKQTASSDDSPEEHSVSGSTDDRQYSDNLAAIRDLFEERDGRFHRDHGISHLCREFGINPQKAVEILERHVEFNDQGWTFSTEHSSFDGDVGALDQKPGDLTGRKWNGLHILEDIGHPLVPDVENYFDRTIAGTSKKDAEVLATAMADADFSPLLVGDAGTGKDTLVRYICAKTNRPCVRVNFGEDVRYADLVGTRMPDSNDGDSFDVVWEDGMLTRAVKYGYVFIADEINAAPPEATIPLHQVTEEGDDAALVIREESKLIEPHPQFRFVATMNPPRGGYGGVKQLNDAFKSRFYTIEVDYLDPEYEAKLLEERFQDDDDVSDQNIEDLTTLASSLRDQYQRGDITTPVTTRELIKICKMCSIMPVIEATRMVLVGHAKENDKRLIKDRIKKELE